MGYVKKISKARLRSGISFRRKPQEPQSKTNDQTWEFHVTSNPKEYTDDNEKNLACGTIETVPSSRSDEEAENNTNAGTTGTSQQVGWGWLLSSCWGGSPNNLIDKIDDVTFESSYDGTGDSSVPSMSRVDHVLELTAKNNADDISDITSVSAASIDDDDDDSNDSESKSNCTQDVGGQHGKLNGGNTCVWWSMG